MSPAPNGDRPLLDEHGRIDASLFGLSDSEVLAIIDDLADENGWTTTVDVRLQLGEDVESRERTGVGIRLAWLRRYGWVEKGERERVESPNPRGWEWSQTWRLTAMGHALLDDPKLSAAVERALGKLNPAQRLRLTREIAEGGQGAPAEIQAALRRQWKRSTGQVRPHRTKR